MYLIFWYELTVYEFKKTKEIPAVNNVIYNIIVKHFCLNVFPLHQPKVYLHLKSSLIKGQICVYSPPFANHAK